MQWFAWNFPTLLASWKLGPALATGNTVVIQPSSSTPLSLKLLKFFQEVLPKGVVNVLTGKGSESGDAIFNHEGVINYHSQVQQMWLWRS